MFNKFNINEKINIKAELLKNRREPIADITDYISKISYKLNSYSTVDISVKKFIMDKNIKKPNPLYNKIKDKMQIILTINDKKERYILMDSTRNIDKNSGIKTFKAYSFEKTLENKLITFSSEGKSYPLVSDDTDEGILDIISKKCGWKIGFVDELAKKEYVYNPIVRTLQIQKNINCLNVQPDQLLWEASTDIYTDIDSVPLNATVEHKGLTRHDYYGDQLTSEETLKITLDPVHTGINNIKAYYYSVAGNRYGIKFLLYLKDGSTITQIKEFTNIRDLQMKCKEVNVIYETGYWDKQFVTKYAWLENIDSNIYSLLNDLQEQFNVVFLFDTYNGVINCYSKDNLNDESPLLLSLDTNVINVDIKQAQNPISAVRVIGKENVSIIDINKYGSDVIYNYDYFRNNYLLSDELMQSLDKYEEFLEVKQLEWNKLSEDRRLLYDNKVKLDCEIKSLSERIVTLSELLAAFISGNASNEEQERIKKEKAELEKLFNENVKLRNSVDVKIDDVNEVMAKITFDIKRENCGVFSSEDLEELGDIDIIENYSNDTATTSDGLYNSASWYLNERTKNTVEFSIKCINLAKFINNTMGWNNVLQLTKLFCIDDELSKEIGEDKVRLIGIDIDASNKSIDNLLFTNKIFPIDLLKKAKQMQKKAITMLMNNRIYRSVWDNSVSTNGFINNIQTNGINIGNTVMRTGELYNVAEYIEETTPEAMSVSLFSLENTESSYEITSEPNVSKYSTYDNDIEQSRAGMFIKSKSNPQNQLYIGAGIFAISSNGFESSEIAIDDNGITAKLLKGKILLGERLYITSDDGRETFYVGNMEENDGFGLCIRDELTGQQRIFLGTELDENGVKKAKLRLTGNNGEVAITEDGLVNTYCFVYNDDLDKENPLVFEYPIDTGTFEVRQCKISIFLQKYRMTVKSLSAGGSVNTTSEGGSVVSTTGNGGYTSTSTDDGGFHSVSESSAESVDFGYNTYTSAQFENENGTHAHEYTYGVARHSHLVNIVIPSHKHGFRVEDHRHSINIPSHSHEVDTTHNHELEAGIFESTLPSNCSLYVNDILVVDKINENTSIDIKDYLNIGQNNTIKITSETLGRIQLNILNKSFVTN